MAGVSFSLCFNLRAALVGDDSPQVYGSELAVYEWADRLGFHATSATSRSWCASGP